MTNATKGRRVRELLSWIIPVAALLLGFGYRCVREPVFVEGHFPASGQGKAGQILSLGVFPRPEGKRTVRITGVHLRGASPGLHLVDTVVKTIDFKDPKGREPVLAQIGPPADARPLRSAILQGGTTYLVIEVRADKPGRYTASGIDLTYHSGLQRGTHHMDVSVNVVFAP